MKLDLYQSLHSVPAIPVYKTKNIRNRMNAVVCVLFLMLVGTARCAKILVLFPASSRSHYILGSALAKGLVEAGHDITIVSPYVDEDPPKNGKYREIILTDFLEKQHKVTKQREINVLDLENTNPIFNIPFLNNVGYHITRKTVEHPNLKKLINSDEHFDAIILEEFLADALKALLHHFNAPLVLFSTVGANAWVNPLVGNPSPPSYISEIFLGHIPPLSFWQRLNSFIFRVLTELNLELIYTSAQNQIMKEHFPYAPDLSILSRNVSLVLLNSHESINQPVPHVPNMVDIGGFHIKPPKELPTHLKDSMDNAKAGVIYFSMGSTIKPSQMSSEIRETLLKAFRKMKQKVLWKWDEETLPGKPDNVELSKWFPQQEILAHPNTKLFITHGGLLSTTETVYHGVPILSFPIFSDQRLNAAYAEENGFGLTLPFSQITEERLSNALDQLINNPKYRNAAKTRSKLMHDRPIKPMDLAVYWIEFVIRHKGAPHLRVAAVDLPWYQYLLLDVIAFIGLTIFSTFLLTYLVIRKIFCKGNKSKVKTN